MSENDFNQYYSGSSDSSSSGTYYAGNYDPYTGKPTAAAKNVKKKKAKKSVGVGGLIAVALCCSLLGGVVGAAGSVAFSRFTGASTGETASASEALEEVEETPSPADSITYSDSSASKPTVVSASSGSMTAADVYAANVNSTVGITTSVTTTNYFGMTTTGAASGSGFILTEEGYIVTNYHVIEDANSITVTTYDGTAYEAALVGYDSDNDLAVLKIEGENLQPVTVGDSSALRVGDEVAAIGNPLGELTFSLTTGVVSALDRQITLSSGTTMNLLQTDCAINAGNSGGALFNMDGEVIGITNAKYSSSGSSSEASIDNVGFAIPISQVMKQIESIMEKGYVSKAYLGVSVSSVSEDVQAFGYPKGACIRSVVAGSPAEEAGLQVQDIVTSVDGQLIEDYDTFANYIGDCEPGDSITMEVFRDNETITVTAVLGEAANTQETTETQTQQEQEQQQQSGDSSQGYGSWPFGYGSGSDGSGSSGNGSGNGWSFNWGFGG